MTAPREHDSFGCSSGLSRRWTRLHGPHVSAPTQIREILSKLRRHPVRTARRGFKKIVLDPRLSATAEGYDAHRLWRDRLTAALTNVRDALGASGLFVVGPLLEKARRHLYYVRFWSLADVSSLFPGYVVGAPRPFRMGSIVSIRNEALERPEPLL